MQGFGHRYRRYTTTAGVMASDQASHTVAVFDQAVCHSVKMQNTFRLEQALDVVSTGDCLLGYIVERGWGAEVVLCMGAPSIRLPPK